MPLSKPVLIAYGIGIVLNYWNDLLWPLLMTSTDNMRTLAVGIASMQGQYSVQYNTMMAASCMAIAPLVVLFLCAQKYFIRGLAVTGMKI
jgi:multiple sugar transport system permease protein